jgi:hypothetical protein
MLNYKKKSNIIKKKKNSNLINDPLCSYTPNLETIQSNLEDQIQDDIQVVRDKILYDCTKVIYIKFKIFR